MSAALKISKSESLGLHVNSETLVHLPLFESLKEAESARRELTHLIQAREFADGTEIIQEEQFGDELHILISGDVAILKNTPEGDRYRVAVLKTSPDVLAAHPIFGEANLLDRDKRSATVVALGPVITWTLSRDRFFDFAQKFPKEAFPIVIQVARMVSGRLRKSNEDLMLLYNALLSEIRGS
jgi:CRP/FNR family cyclic AMP-dependent transcriptional regulator